MAEVNWPSRYRPEATAVHVRNELVMDARAEQVWAWLIRASRWPEWYPNAHAVRIAGAAHDLSTGASFDWRTFGAAVHSVVEEFFPPERIGWTGRGFGLDIYHGWVIEPRAGGCWVLTEENQNGIAARVQALLLPRRMHRYHQLWLERLGAKAREGMPG
jgi:hypothetical protein